MIFSFIVVSFLLHLSAFSSLAPWCGWVFVAPGRCVGESGRDVQLSPRLLLRLQISELVAFVKNTL